MKVTSLIWYFDRALHDVDDKKYKDLKIPTKVGILNRAIDYFFDYIMVKRSEHPLLDQWLTPLMVDDYELKLIKKQDSFYLFKYPEHYATTTYVFVHAEKGECKSVFEAHPIMDKSFVSAIKNPLWCPFFEMEHTFRTRTKDGVKIAVKDFSINNAIMSYIRRPPKIHAASLVEESGVYRYHDKESINYDVDLLLGETGYNPIIEIAVLLATDNGGDLSLQLQKIINIKNIV